MPVLPKTDHLLTCSEEENYETFYCQTLEEIDDILIEMINRPNCLFPVPPRPVQICIGYEGRCYSLIVSVGFGLPLGGDCIIAFYIKFRELVVFGERWIVEERNLKTFDISVRQVIRNLIRLPHSSDFYL